jgi:hypothetical protein
MDTLTSSCATDGCQRQGQATQSRWCEACGLPNWPDPNALPPTPLRQPSQPAGPASQTGSGPVRLDGRGSGIIAIGVVVVLTTLVLIATHSMLGIGGGDAAAVAQAPSTYSPADVPVEPSTPETTTGGEPTTSEESTTTEEPTTTDTTTTGPAAELAGGASPSATATAPDSKDDAGNVVSYEAAHVLDADPSTAWRAKGDGLGVTVTLTFSAPATITEVGLIPGYDKVDPTSGRNRFYQNHRVSQVRWHFDDGTVVEQRFSDQPTMQRQAVDVTSTVVTIEVVATRPCQPGFDYTPISEVSVIGTQ